MTPYEQRKEKARLEKLDRLIKILESSDLSNLQVKEKYVGNNVIQIVKFTALRGLSEPVLSKS